MQNLDSFTYKDMTELATEMYDYGLSCLDLIKWVEKTDIFDDKTKGGIFIYFDEVKSEYRNEKLLLLCILDRFFRDD